MISIVASIGYSYGMATEGQDPRPPQETLLGKKYAQLLGYVAELDRLRTTTVTTVDGHPDRIDLSSLPDHPSISWDVKHPSEFLTVERCSVPDSPACPKSLEDWVQYRPNQFEVEPSFRMSIYAEEEELHWEQSGPIEDWNTWIRLWKLWEDEARRASAARALYIRLYDLHASLERSSDIELVAADVAVAWKAVDHPILISPVHIDLDVLRSRITVGCQEETAQVYGDAIRSLLPEAGESIARARKELEEDPSIWAFGETEVDLFATRFVQGADSAGQFVYGERRRDQLTARRSPWLLLRKRASGLAELADGLKAKFKEDGDVPGPIQPILVDRPDPGQRDPDWRGEPDEDELSYFTKPANAEQLAILRNFRASGCVHVQGPPGTGKTHTIANLVGHFLAEGKSILVTSEKAQALTVLREKVVEELRPLCVSLAGADAGEGFKAAMRGLYERLGSTERSQLLAEAERLSKARNRTIQELREARQTMREIIEREHLPVEVRGRRQSPTAAGKYLNQHRGSEGWIPGEVLAASEPALTQPEFNDLLDLLIHFSGDVVPEIRKPLPPASEVPLPQEFRELVVSLNTALTTEPPNVAVNVPEIRTIEGEAEAAEVLLRDVDSALEQFKSLDPNYRELANRAFETPQIVRKWELWTERAEAILEKEQRYEAEAAPYEFSANGDTQSILESARRLLLQVQKSGRAIWKPRFFNRDDKLLFESVECKRKLGDEASLAALIHHLEFQEERSRFRDELRAAARSNGLSSLNTEDCERKLRRDSGLRVALSWASDSYRPIVAQLDAVGLGSKSADLYAKVNQSGSGPVEKMAWWLEAVVRPSLVRYQHARKTRLLSERLEEQKAKAKTWQIGNPSQALLALSEAILSQDLDAYKAAFADVSELRTAAEPVQRRDALLEKLRGQAATFAEKLESGTFDFASIHGTFDSAWTYALIDQELNRRNSLSLEGTKDELDRLKQQLDVTTVNLASARAWAAQHRRVTQPVHSALSRFHEAQKKIGGGQGKRVPELLRAMRSAMLEAKDAFPVWIMPLHDLARSFDFTKTKFDVVIIDESSQLSAIGLITLLIADSAIVVGDDEQTEPSLPGVSFDSIQALIREHLVDFPDRILWSPDASLYSFAGRFGAAVGLREHFRCVPQIISFSSKLCYHGKIQALRESKGVAQVPHVVPIPCASPLPSSGRDVNEAEAAEIASLIIACSELPAYDDQTFGVIALRGSADGRGSDPQSECIISLVRAALGAAEWERFAFKSKFKTGTPPAFQGDERDVVFVSMGDNPQSGGRSGPLTLLKEGSTPGNQYRKRMNVAVSRARNQVWIVHSFQHFEAELKEGDIRRRLLEFAYAPNEWLESTLAVNPKAESPFEQAVYADLVRLGFTVIPQVPVGHYRIDLVAEGIDARVAIECDGDAYHQDAAADLSRQIVLERCGWKFVRVRGSEYYRHPERALQRIVKELERLGVTPSVEQPIPTEPEGALLQRVRARALEIRPDVLAGRPVTVAATPRFDELEPEPEPALGEPEADTALTEVMDVGGTSPNASAVVENSSYHNEVTSDSSLPIASVVASAEGSPLRPLEYVEFSETGFKDPKLATLREIQSDLVKIIEVEGPATEARIIDRYRVATEYGRFKGPTRELVVDALRSAASSGLVRTVPDYPGADVVIYFLPGQPEVRLRKRGPRDLHDVPIGEIVAFASQLARSGQSGRDEHIYRSILDFFDLKRLTQQASERIGKALELAESGARSGAQGETVGTSSLNQSLFQID